MHDLARLHRNFCNTLYLAALHFIQKHLKINQRDFMLTLRDGKVKMIVENMFETIPATVLAQRLINMFEIELLDRYRLSKRSQF